MSQPLINGRSPGRGTGEPTINKWKVVGEGAASQPLINGRSSGRGNGSWLWRSGMERPARSGVLPPPNLWIGVTYGSEQPAARSSLRIGATCGSAQPADLSGHLWRRAVVCGEERSSMEKSGRLWRRAVVYGEERSPGEERSSAEKKPAGEILRVRTRLGCPGRRSVGLPNRMAYQSQRWTGAWTGA